MVKPRLKTLHSLQPRKRFHWWRGLLGALLTFLFIVPYMMGGDVEKYLRQWLAALNQGSPGFHLELTHYQRHWFTSDGDIQISGGPLHEALNIHIKAFHGPLFLNAGQGIRLGLSLIKGTVDPNQFLGQQETIQFAGPIQLTAFVPYFRDRELRTQFPAITIQDKQNQLIYSVQTLKGNIDGDGLLQMQVPSLKVSRLEDGSELVKMDSGVLRILPRSLLASFAAKQIDIYRKDKETVSISNFLLQANTQNINGQTDTSPLDLSLHFDELKGLTFTKLNASPADFGPFEFKLKVSGLHTQGVMTILEILKVTSIQPSDLTPAQGEMIEKAWSSIFSTDTAYELSSNLSTHSGQLKAQFQGGFTLSTAIPLKDSSELFDAFYSKGSIELTADLKDALAQYATPRPQDPENLPSNEEVAMAALLGFLKPQGENFAAQVDIQHGRIMLNGQDVKKQDEKK